MSSIARNCVLLATLGLSQAPAEVVINEIFYHSPADLNRLEFVELYNTSEEAVDLSGWRFSAGVDYDFPDGTSLGGHAFHVLCGDKALFEKLYGVEADGEFEKSLSNGGETVTLRDGEDRKVDSVKYDDKAPWPKSADGYSASLERISPVSGGNDPFNWAPSVLSGDYDRLPSGTPGKPNSVLASARPPVIEDVGLDTEVVDPGQAIAVSAKMENDAEVEKLELLYRVASPGEESEEQSLPMKQGEDGRYWANIPGHEKSNRIVRLRVRAEGAEGAARFHPHPNDIRPALSVYVKGDLETGKIPVGQFFNVGAEEQRRAAEYRSNSLRSRGGRGMGGRRFGREETEEERRRRETLQRLENDSLVSFFSEVSLAEGLGGEQLSDLAQAFKTADQSLSGLQREGATTQEWDAFSGGVDEKLTAIRDGLERDTASLLSDEQRRSISKIGAAEEGGGRGGRRFRPEDLMSRMVNVEGTWFRVAMRDDLNPEQLETLASTHRGYLAKRQEVIGGLLEGGNIDFRSVMEEGQDLMRDLSDDVERVLSGEDVERRERGRADDPRRQGDRGRERGDRGDRRGDRGRFGRGFGGRGGGAFPNDGGPALLPQGRSAFVYIDPKSGEPQLYDFVNITPRKSGHKVRFHKDRPFNGMTTVNVLFESDQGTTINEAFAYDLYRRAGNATVNSGFMRVLIDGEVAGYHLWFEQPNGSFFRRNDIDDEGNLYKLIWMGSHEPSAYTPKEKIPERGDIVGRHEKKTHPHDGYEDIVEIIELLEGAQGDDERMWKLIQEHFEVDQVINYFAVNSLLSHWDGFFNNYFLYHDVEGSGKWSMYPWDQDSTWSLRMGNVDELSEMPLNFGAEGARPPGAPEVEERSDRGGRGRGGFRGFGGGRGGPGWWRDGGDVSRPLLANFQFYARFEARLKHLIETVFTENVLGPEIDALAEVLGPEVRLRAEAGGQSVDDAERELERIMTGLREHLEKRRAFVLAELEEE